MRLLIACQPVRSHLHSLAPVALAAARMGHAVAVATGAELASLVRALGLDYLACGRDAVPNHLLEKLPGFVAPPAAPPAMRQLLGFINCASAYATDLLARCAEWQPDLILREPVEFGSPIAAELLQLPYASVMWGLYISPRFLIDEAYATVFRRFGLDGEALVAHFDPNLVIKFLPPSWQVPMPPDPPTARSFHVPPFDHLGDQTLPAWVAELPARPTLYVTLGLSFSQAPELFRAILAAVDGLYLNVVVTVGGELEPALLGALPANVHLERYIPGSLLLPHCDAVLFHGGFNTLHSALWHGLPLVVVPLEAGDQTPTAEQVAAMGLGLQLPGPLPSVEALRNAIVRVLAEPHYGEAARALRKEMQSTPSIDDAVRRLEALAASPRRIGAPEPLCIGQ